LVDAIVGPQTQAGARPEVEHVGALACLHLDELRRNLDTLGNGEPGDGFPLAFNLQAVFALLASRNRRLAIRSSPTLPSAHVAGQLFN
jgi:hypothetical protein